MARKLGFQLKINNENEIRQQYDKLVKDFENKEIKMNFNDNGLSNLLKSINKINEELSKTNFSKVLSNLDTINEKINNINTNATKIKIDEKSFIKSENIINDIKKQYEQLGQVKLDKTFNPLTKELEAVNVVIKQTNGETKKLKYALSEINGVKGFTLTSDKLVDTNAQATYKQLISLQKEEFNIKNQLIKAEGEHKNTLEQRLTSIKQEQQEVGKLINQQSLSNNYNNNQVIQDRIRLTTELTMEQAKYNDKIREESKNTEQAIKNFKDNMNTRLQNLQTRYGSVAKSGNIGDEIANFRKELDGLNSNNFDVKKLNNEFNQISANCKEAKNNVGGFGAELKRAFGKLMAWFSVGAIISRTVTELQGGITTIYSLDNALNNMSLTMDKSNKTFDNMGKSAMQFSKELHTSLDATTKAMAIFSNLNATVDEILEKSKPALILSNLTGNDVNTSADALQGIIYQFDQTSDSASHFSDVISQLAASTGVEFSKSIQEMTNSVARGGAVADQVGLKAEQYLSIIATINEKTRLSGETISSGLDTVFSRISRVSSLDNTEMSKVEKVYKGIGVSLKDSNGEFRDMWDILTDLNNVWGGLNSTQKSYVSELSAGIRQKKQFLALINNFDDIQQRYNESLNAEGFAMEANEKYADSFKAKMQDLKNVKDEIFTNTLNSDGIKTLVSDFTSILSITGKIVEKIGLLPVIITAIGTGIGSKNIIKNITKDVSGLKGVWDLNPMVQGLKSLKTILTTIGTQFKTTGISTTSFKTALNTVGIQADISKLKLLGLKFGAVALQSTLTMGLSFAITGIIEGISHWIHKNEELKQSNEELISQVKENTSSNNEMIRYLQDEGKEYDTLAKKTSLTTDEQKKLNDIKSKIAQTFPELISGYDEENNVILKQSTNTKELIELLKEKNKIENMKLLTNGSNALETTQNDLKKIAKEKQSIQDDIDKFQNGDTMTTTGQYYNDANNIDNLQNKIEELKKKKKDGANVDKEIISTQEKLNTLIEKRKEKTDELNVLTSEQKTILAGFKPYIDAIVKEQENLTETQRKVLTDAIELKPDDMIKLKKGDFTSLRVQANKIVDDLQESKAVKNIEVLTTIKEPTTDDYQKYISDLQEISKITNKTPIELSQEFKVNPKGIDKYIQDLEKQLKSATGKSKEKLQNALDIAKNIQIDVEVNGEESLDALGDKLDEASEKAKELKDALSESFNNIEKYNGFLKEIGEDGKLSASSVKEILLNYPQLIAYLGDEQAMRNKLNELVGQEKEINKKNVIEMMENDKDFYKNRISTNSDLVKKVGKLYDVDLTNYKTIAQAKLGVEKEMLGALTKKYGEFFKFKNNMFSVDIKSFLDANGGTINRGNIGKLKELEKAAEEQNKQREELMKEFDKGLDFSDLDAVIDKIGGLGSSAEETGNKTKDSANKAEKAMSDTEKQILATEQAMKVLENRVTRLSRQQEKLNEHTQSYRNGLIEKQKIIKDEIALIEKQIKLNERLRDNPSERNSYDPEKGGSVAGNQIIQEAEKYLNTPYLWGGTTPDGFDCSGFVQYVYKQLGKEISRSTGTQFNEGTPLGRKDLQPGDLVFFGSDLHHVGIYAGDNQVIHSPQDNDVVKYSDIDAFGDYYGARRIIPSGGSGSSTSGIRSSYSGAYAAEINKAAQSYGIDPNLLAAIAKVESNFNPNVTSHAGAMGMFQFMPGTAEAFGVNPWDVQSSANGAAKYLKYLIDMFGNVDQAIQAYNAGEGNIGNGIIPAETQAYLPKVKEAMASFGGGYSNNGTISSVQAQYDYNGKIIDLRGKIEELEDQYSKLYIEILNSHLGEYEDKLKNIERIQEQYRIDVELSGEFNKSYINNLNEVLTKEKDKIKLLEQERAFIKTELTSNKYDSKTIDMLNEKYKELGTQMLNVRNESKKLGYEFAEAKWSSIQKLYNDNMELIENKLNRLQLHEEKNIQAIMQLNKQKVEQEQANIERIQALMEELNQRSLTEPFYLDKLAEFNKQLDDANTKLEQAKKELEEVGEKIKNAFSPVESKIKEVIQKSVENSKTAIDKNLKYATDAIDKEIKALDDAQKRNSWNENKTSQANKINDLKRQIAELQADNSSEANSKRKDLQKQLQDELNKSKDMQMKHNADLKKEELNKQKQDLQSEAEKEKKILDVRLENLYLVQEVKDSLLDGYIDDINGQRVEIENALLDYLNIYGEGMSLAGDTFKKEILDAVEIAKNLLKGFDKETGFDINKINDNSKTKTIYGTAVDLENAKKIYGADYNYIDTSLVDTSKIQFKKGDLILGGVGTHNGVSQTNIGEATRLEGHGRYDTARVMQLYKDIQSGKIKARNGIVYCNSQADVELARQYLMGLGYTQFVDLSKVKDINSLNIGDNDLIVGGSQFTNKGTYLSGKDRYDTLNKVKDYTNNITEDMIDKNYKDTTKRYVYGNSTDIGIAKSYLNKYGYDFIETNDVRDKNVSDKDIIVGGQVHGAEKVVNAGGQWLWGKNRQATEEEIRKFERKLRGLPGFSQGGIVDFTNIAALHGSKSSVETIFNATQGKKLYNFVDGLPDHFLDSYSKFKMPENKTTNNTTETRQTIIQKAEFVFPNVRNEHDANKFSENILKIMNTGNMQ